MHIAMKWNGEQLGQFWSLPEDALAIPDISEQKHNYRGYISYIYIYVSRLIRLIGVAAML